VPLTPACWRDRSRAGPVSFIDRVHRYRWRAGILRTTPLQSLHRLARTEDGGAALEFGLVAAPFLALLVALFQTAMVFFASRVLDEIVANASRYIMTGQAQLSGMSASGFATYVCNQTLALFNCNNFMINVQNYGSFSAASTSTPALTFDAQGGVSNTWSWSPGNPGDIVVVQVMYQWPVALGPLGFNLANLSNGNRLLVSTAVFKNEPY
jgi:Flp pilus assembly protein TadG